MACYGNQDKNDKLMTRSKTDENDPSSHGRLQNNDDAVPPVGGIIQRIIRYKKKQEGQRQEKKATGKKKDNNDANATLELVFTVQQDRQAINISTVVHKLSPPPSELIAGADTTATKMDDNDAKNSSATKKDAGVRNEPRGRASSSSSAALLYASLMTRRRQLDGGGAAGMTSPRGRRYSLMTKMMKINIFLNQHVRGGQVGMHDGRFVYFQTIPLDSLFSSTTMAENKDKNKNPTENVRMDEKNQTGFDRSVYEFIDMTLDIKDEFRGDGTDHDGVTTNERTSSRTSALHAGGDEDEPALSDAAGATTTSSSYEPEDGGQETLRSMLHQLWLHQFKRQRSMKLSAAASNESSSSSFQEE